MVFNESVYAYPAYVYKALYVTTILVCLFGSSYSIIQATATGIEWKVIYTPSNTFNYCRIDNEGTYQEKVFRLPLIAVCFVVNFVINIILLYMFNRGLWLLNKEIMIGMMHDAIQPQMEMTTPSEECSQDANIKIKGSSARNLQVIVEKYKKNQGTNKYTDHSAKRVIQMYNVMKKQTILTCIAIVSTSIYFIWTAITQDASWETGWDLSINLICSWLMLSSSSMYWDWCKNKGLCRCCYFNTRL